jgi:hypothetical protein
VGPQLVDISPWSSPDRCSLGCRVDADSDLGTIGDVHLIARLQAPDEGLHSRVVLVDSVGHAFAPVKVTLVPSVAAETMVTRAAVLMVPAETAEAVFASITHLRFDPRLPFTREIVAYQKHRVKRLRIDRPHRANDQQCRPRNAYAS